MGRRRRPHRGSGGPKGPAPGPIRTCCGCGERDGRRALIRLALGPDGSLVVDLRGRMPGRGAWIHPRRACVERLVARPRSLERALRASPELGGLAAALRQAVHRAALDGLAMAAAAGLLVGGRDRLGAALRAGQVQAVVVARDASPRTLGELRRLAPEDLPFVPVDLDTSALGARVGKGPRAALGVRPGSAAAHLQMQLRRLSTLG